VGEAEQVGARSEGRSREEEAGAADKSAEGLEILEQGVGVVAQTPDEVVAAPTERAEAIEAADAAASLELFDDRNFMFRYVTVHNIVCHAKRAICHDRRARRAAQVRAATGGMQRQGLSLVDAASSPCLFCVVADF
jgi:hypothetical protein